MVWLAVRLGKRVWQVEGDNYRDGQKADSVSGMNYFTANGIELLAVPFTVTVTS